MSEKSGGNQGDKPALPGPSLSVEKTIVGKPIQKNGNRRGVLRVAEGLDAGRIVSIPPGAVVTFGRSEECVCRFDDTSLSRVHAKVMLSIGGYVFQDMNSTNGSYVNDQQIQGAVTLRDGDRIQLGSSTLLRFALVDEAEELAAKRVYEAALRDGLTGVFNRKHLEERLDAEIAFALRHNSPMSVAIFDVDKFKAVNDTYGHQAGDAVLKATAGILGSTLRTEDLLARFGGEEFVIVLRGVALDGGVAMAERLRVQLAKTPIVFGAISIPVTASAGVAAITCCGATPDKATIVRIADERLYTAKQTGRNRVVGG
jgi:diguanylate cyclase (GGDEF)-like protein